ncbi:hypothetical protein ACFX11_009112 [Malus domestica]
MGTSVQVTPLCGVYNENPLSYLVLINGFNFLIDCCWNDHFDPSFLQPLSRVASTVDTVLLSHLDTLHLGALLYAMKQLGLSVPVFSIEPVYRLGLLTMHNCRKLLKLCISRRRRTGEDRGLGCTKLISPEDMLQACSLWEKFDVPVMLQKFDSGVMVIQNKSHSQEENCYRGYLPSTSGNTHEEGCQLRKLHLQSSNFESSIYKSSSFESFIYKSSDFKASFTQAPASKGSFTKLRLQNFTYKASVHDIQRPPPNNRHFGPYMD